MDNTEWAPQWEKCENLTPYVPIQSPSYIPLDTPASNVSMKFTPIIHCARSDSSLSSSDDEESANRFLLKMKDLIPTIDPKPRKPTPRKPGESLSDVAITDSEYEHDSESTSTVSSHLLLEGLDDGGDAYTGSSTTTTTSNNNNGTRRRDEVSPKVKEPKKGIFASIVDYFSDSPEEIEFERNMATRSVLMSDQSFIPPGMIPPEIYFESVKEGNKRMKKQMKLMRKQAKERKKLDMKNTELMKKMNLRNGEEDVKGEGSN